MQRTMHGLPSRFLQDCGEIFLAHARTRQWSRTSFLDAGDVSRASVSVRALRRSGMPASEVEEAARRAVSPIRAQVEAGIEKANSLRATLSASAGDTATNRGVHAGPGNPRHRCTRPVPALT